MRRRTSLSIIAISCALAMATACGGGGTGTPPKAAGPGSTGPGAAGPAGTGGGSRTANPRFAGFSSETYAKPENWLCGKGAAEDRCRTENLDTTVIKADGTMEVKHVAPAADPGFDCFYVYPTVNLTGDADSDEAMAADITTEVSVVRAQAARFSEVCRVYAPLYRQLTLKGFGSANRDALTQRAFDDVHESFRQYMSKWNEGRPVLMLGHSQGSFILLQLLEKEFDGDAELRAQLVSAMLIGGRTEVPAGSDRGGSFANIPACTADTQTGCVIGFNSVAADTEAGDLARWGGASPGKDRLCTNPAALGGGGPAPLRSILANQGSFLKPGLTSTAATPWVELDGLLDAECVHDGSATVLRITAAPAAGDQRDIGDRVKSVPGWGLHISEVGLTQGNLIEIARKQGAAKG